VCDRRARSMLSFPLGAVRLTERYLSGSEPVKKKDLGRVRAHVRESLDDVEWLAGSGRRLVGMGGAARNLAEAVAHAQGQLDLGVQGFVITPKKLSELVHMLASMPAAERGSVPGIQPGR